MYHILDIQGSRDSGVNQIAVVGGYLGNIDSIYTILDRDKIIYSPHNSYRSDKNIC